MSEVHETSESTAASSAMASVQAAIDSLTDYTPRSDDGKIAALKEEAEKLRKLRKENRRLQRNEKRKRSRLLAKGSGWDSQDILECFRLKHENAVKRQKIKQERMENANKDKIPAAADQAQTRTDEEVNPNA